LQPNSAPPVVIVEPATEAAVLPTALPVAPTGLVVPPDSPPQATRVGPPAVSLPLPTPANGLTATVNVPILMYHYISAPPEDAAKYREDLSVTPQAFREQLQYLADNGYTTIDLYDLILAVTRQQALPPKPVILTF